MSSHKSDSMDGDGIDHEEYLDTRSMRMEKMNSLLKQLPSNLRGLGEEVLHTISCGRILMGWNDRL